MKIRVFTTLSVLGLIVYSCLTKTDLKTEVTIKEVKCKIDDGFVQAFVSKEPILYKWNTRDLKFEKYGFQNRGFEYYNEITYHLPKGLYQIEHITLFDTIEYEQFKIEDQKELLIEICYDQFDHSKAKHVSFIDKLQLNEFYSITFQSFDCSICDSTWVITRGENNYYLKSNKLTKILSISDVELIRNTEIELYYIYYGLSPHMDTYTFRYKDELVRLKNHSFDWQGFQYLFSQLKK